MYRSGAWGGPPASIPKAWVLPRIPPGAACLPCTPENVLRPSPARHAGLPPASLPAWPTGLAPSRMHVPQHQLAQAPGSPVSRARQRLSSDAAGNWGPGPSQARPKPSRLEAAWQGVGPSLDPRVLIFSPGRCNSLLGTPRQLPRTVPPLPSSTHPSPSCHGPCVLRGSPPSPLLLSLPSDHETTWPTLTPTLSPTPWAVSPQLGPVGAGRGVPRTVSAPAKQTAAQRADGHGGRGPGRARAPACLLWHPANRPAMPPRSPLPRGAARLFKAVPLCG